MKSSADKLVMMANQIATNLALEPDPAGEAWRMLGNDPQKRRCTKIASGNNHLVNKLHLHPKPLCCRNVVRDEDAARFPDIGIDRSLEIQQVARDGFQKAPLRIADHVGVDSAAVRGWCQAHTGHDVPILVHADPPACRRVILIELHAVGFRQVPLGVLDERPVAGPEHVREQLTMIVEVVVRQRRSFHSSLSFFWSFKTLEGTV